GYAETLAQEGVQSLFPGFESGGDPVRGCAALAFRDLSASRTGDTRRKAVLGRPVYQLRQERAPGWQSRLRAQSRAGPQDAIAVLTGFDERVRYRPLFRSQLGLLV